MAAESSLDMVAHLEDEYLTLEVTRKCDSGCFYCFALRHLSPSQLQTIPGETILSIAREGYRCGWRRIHFTGGEPSLHRDLPELMEPILSLGYRKILINTGARQKDLPLLQLPEKFNRSVEYSVTLCGPREIHDSLRGEGSWREARDGIQSLKSRGFRVQIYTIMVPELIPLLSRFCEELFTGPNPPDGISLIQMHSSRVHDRNDPLMLTPEQFITTARVAGLLQKIGIPISVLDNPLWNLAADRCGFPLPPSRSIYRTGRVTIFADLSLSTAHSSRSQSGKWREGALEEMLRGKSRNLNEESRSEECHRCIYRSICSRYEILHPSEIWRGGRGAPLFCREVNRILEERKPPPGN